ncbi:SGNH hydrolase domain-containing protein [Mycobacterium sp. DL]|uniref:SGNH hydrolase domain-containing protein n=1 Tax=Mycobacteriaceae TaxID=1762 RepID=UPI00321BCFD8
MASILTIVLTSCSTYGGTEIPSYQANEAVAGSEVSGLATQSYATTDEVIAAVAAAQQTQELPSAAAQQLATLSQGQVQDGPENCFDRREMNAVTPDATFGECAYGDPEGTKQMVIYGDSRAPMWAASLERVAAVSGWQLRVFAKGGCPAADLSFENNETNAPDPDCDAFRSAAIEEIRKLQPQLVVTASHAGHRLANGEMPTNLQWQAGWESTFQKLAQPGSQLAILGAIPNWDTNGAQCVAAHARDIQACSTERANAVSPYFDAEREAASAAGVLYVDTVPWVCTERCQPVIADTIVYYNPYHFTKGYADYLSGAVADALKPVMA